MPSLEDVAWADSCLTKDPDLIDSGWNSLRDALFETLSDQPDSRAQAIDNSPEGAEMDTTVETSNINNFDQTSVNTAVGTEGTEPETRGSLNHEYTADFWSRHKIQDIFLPTYNESLRDLGDFYPEVEGSEAINLEESTEGIFKIWDLDIPLEEDDLIKQLNKALAESSLELTNPVSDDSLTWKGLEDESLDDLISGIADISLSPKPS